MEAALLESIHLPREMVGMIKDYAILLAIRFEDGSISKQLVSANFYKMKNCLGQSIQNCRFLITTDGNCEMSLRIPWTNLHIYDLRNYPFGAGHIFRFELLFTFNDTTVTVRMISAQDGDRPYPYLLSKELVHTDGFDLANIFLSFISYVPNTTISILD